MLRKIQYNSPVVLSFALISFLALVLGRLTGGASTMKLFCVYRASLTDPLTYVRFFGHVLGHTSFEHYIGNMLLLLVIGPSIEEKYGSANVLKCMAVTALITGLVQFLLFPGNALLGASGMVFMMIILSSFAGKSEGKVPLTLILVTVLYIGNEILTGVYAGADGVSQLTHVLGGACGLAMGFMLERRRA